MGELRLMKGNEAVAEAAIRAGCDGYFGYPITPQSEIMEYLMVENPHERTGMVVLQAESEVASINMLYGGGGTGKMVMTSSSSPGISLMQEGISYMAGAELPCLIVNVVRGGPGLGTIQPSQADYFQATKGGGHGDYHIIVLAPASVQEMCDFAKLGFELAFRYRTPVLILSDGAIGQMMEKVELFDPIPRRSDEEVIRQCPWAATGKTKDREHIIITSLDLDPAGQEKINLKLQAKYRQMEQEEVRYEMIQCEDAEYIFVAFGLSARICQKAVDIARAKNIKVGLFRPITLFPFPAKAIAEISDKVKGILVVEMNAGQMIEDVKLSLGGSQKIEHYGRFGGIIPAPDEVVMALEQKKLSEVNMEEQFAKPEIRKDENIVYRRTPLLVDRPLSYCPGCGHGVVHRLLMETLEEMDIQDKTIGISPVGCSVLAYDFMNIDMLGAAHGRAPALATAIKRMWPEKFIFTYQGDGDLAAIGTAETIHACNRGENFVIIFINNGIYGMTGGQMAPTTLPGMRSSTSPYGRDVKLMGNPLKMTELVAQLPGTYFVTRQAVHTPNHVRRAKKAIRKAFENQKLKTGISFVEVVSNCNSGWKMTPVNSNKWMEENMFPFYPLGDIKVDGKMVEPKVVAEKVTE